MEFIESGIPGFDELISLKEEFGGIPKNTNTLIYGPPKTGKTIFCNQFIYQGLQNADACLYISTDHGIRQLQTNMIDFQWFIQNYIQSQTLYIIDGISKLSGGKLEDSANLKFSTINNPAELMVKIGMGIGFVYKKSNDFRSILDSLTTLFAFNPQKTVVNFLNAYLKRVNEAGGSGLVAYTEGVADPDTEIILKSLFDNKIRLDGEYMNFERISEDIDEISTVESAYEISDQGLTITKL
jgi:KaiC/GvpD/RAD55 family RecA-like ATPase